MRKFLYTYKRELVYSILLFVVWEMAQVPEVLGLTWAYVIYSFLGLILIISWTITSYLQFSGKKVSKFSDVLIKIQLRERFFLYFVLPVLFYMLVTLYLFVNRNILLNQLIIVICTALYFVMFVHIRSSYEKVFSISRYTRVIFTLLDIVTFYLIVAITVLYGTTNDIRVLVVIFASALLLTHQLVIHKQKSLNSLLVLVFSVAFISVVSVLFINTSYLVFPVVMTLAFYLVISWWNVRLDGHKHYGEYLPPLLFSLMAFIIVMSF